ncbi:MAG: Rrf2 family transcriptional regulator [Phycisphaeraceae bacterium]|nr:Rrf2 family transcriptional regulator [Phycisphaeraceae bacterium]
MHLTQFTDYSLRVLIYLGLHQDRLVSISEISEAYEISRNHLLKVVHHLTKAGYVDGIRGRNGGLKLSMKPEKIIIGKVVRVSEPNFNVVECFSKEHNTCPIAPNCKLKSIFNDAVNSFLEELDKHSLSEILSSPQKLTQLLT